jgi:membrane-bound serine protease (ClpP class)
VGLLFFIAIACIYLELHLMTGALGLVSAFCFILFFWSKWLGGTAGTLEILLFIFGLFGLAMEIFVMPGVGVFGLTGVLSLVASLVMASQTFSMLDEEHGIEDATRTMGMLGGSIIAVAVVAMTISRYLPQIPFLKHMVLTPPGSLGGDASQPRLRPDSLSGGGALVGRHGTASTLLRPAGKAEIDGRVVDVVSDGGMIAAGSLIEVVHASQNRIVVRETESRT